MAKIAAPTISFGTPRMRRPSNFVNSTTTSSGTRKMRVTVSEVGRFMQGVPELPHAARGNTPREEARGRRETRRRREDGHAPRSRQSVVRLAHDNIGGCHEGDSPRGGQGHPPPAAHHSYAQADRADLRSAVPPLSAGSPEAG